MSKPVYILFFNEIGIDDIPRVGGKNASLGEMYNQLNSQGIEVPNGFALTAKAYRSFCKKNKLDKPLHDLLNSLDTREYSNLTEIGEEARSLILNAKLPNEITEEVIEAYKKLSEHCGVEDLDVAVRSSATAEDLPLASFAGRMESFLNISGEEQLLEAVHRCYASLFTDRAIKYRHDMGFTGSDLAISIGIQQMVRSDVGASGVIFTIDPDNGFRDVVIVNSCWGLGENIVQGSVIPDEWIVFKPTLFDDSLNPILKMNCGQKEHTMSYAKHSQNGSVETTILNIETPKIKQDTISLTPKEVIQLARWSCIIENHYGKAMDIEWAKDGMNQKIYILQARPETVYGKQNKVSKEIYKLKKKGKTLAYGIALGDKIAAGKARIISKPEDGYLLQKGDVLVTDITNPDWEPLMKKASAIITNKGGRTSHAAIVARELGTVAVVGCGNATEVIQNRQDVTVSCAEGKKGNIYDGVLEWDIIEQDISKLALPCTAPMLILADPEQAFKLSHYPNKGVGLLRLEFAISNSIRIHPMALIEPEKILDKKVKNEIQELTKNYSSGESYFVDKLAESVSMVAAAFYPKDVIVRMSDFKSNEYKNLIGGEYFEPDEENPMIGLRGASRYYSNMYRKGFALECEAMKKVRDEMGLKNVKLMIPFCRTIEEGKLVLIEMEMNGLKQKENGLEIYLMIEIPSNVILANEFAQIFDGFSIGSNDLTQLTLGIDRDSALLSNLFNEENCAVKALIKESIRAAKRNGIKVGICGQAPSDSPAFARFLVEEGIDSISFNPDALIKGVENIIEAEKHKPIPKWLQ